MKYFLVLAALLFMSSCSETILESDSNNDNQSSGGNSSGGGDPDGGDPDGGDPDGGDPDGGGTDGGDPAAADLEWQLKSTIKANSLIYSVAFSRYDEQIVSGGSDHTVRVWDARTEGPVTMAGSEYNAESKKGHTNHVQSAAFNYNAATIVSGGDDGTVRVWNWKPSAKTYKMIKTIKGHTGQVASVAFSSDGKKIVSGGADRTVRVWDWTINISNWSDAKAGEKLWVGSKDNDNSEISHADVVSSVAFSPDGKQIVSGSADHTIRVWNAETGSQLWVGGSVDDPISTDGHKAKVTSVAFSPNGKQIVSGSNDLTIRVWDAKTGSQLWVGGSMGNTKSEKGHTNNVMSVAFSRDGKQIVSGSNDYTVRVWDWNGETGSQLWVGGRVGNTNSTDGHTRSVTSVAFSRYGKKIVSGGSDYTIRIWDLLPSQ